MAYLQGFQAIKTKFSYKQPHKRVTHGVWRPYNFFGTAQNTMENKQGNRNYKIFVLE